MCVCQILLWLTSWITAASSVCPVTQNSLNNIVTLILGHCISTCSVFVLSWLFSVPRHGFWVWFVLTARTWHYHWQRREHYRPGWSACHVQVLPLSESKPQVRSNRLELTEPGICCGNGDSRVTENRKSGKIYFLCKKNRQVYFFFFFLMKIEMMDLWMPIESTKLIFIMNFSVLDFFRFASRMPQISQIRLVVTFTIFRGWMGGGREGQECTRTLPHRNFLLFFPLTVPCSELSFWLGWYFVWCLFVCWLLNPYLTRKSSESSTVGPREPRLELGSRPGRFGEL